MMQKPTEPPAPSAKGKNNPFPSSNVLNLYTIRLMQKPIFRAATMPANPANLHSSTEENVLLVTAQFLRQATATVHHALKTNSVEKIQEAFSELCRKLDMINNKLSNKKFSMPGAKLWEYFEVIFFYFNFFALTKEFDDALLPSFIETLLKLINLYKTFFKLLKSNFDQEADKEAKTSLKEIYSMLAESYFKTKKWDEAKKYYKKHYQLFRQFNTMSPDVSALAYEFYCSRNVIVAIKRGKVRKARQYAALCETALQSTESYEFIFRTGKTIQEAYQEIGLYYLRQGNLDFALYWYQRALAIPSEETKPKIQTMINTTQKRIFAQKREKLMHLLGFQIDAITCQWDENNFNLTILTKNDAAMALIQEILDKELVEYRLDEQNKLSITLHILPVNFRVFHALDDKLYQYQQACLAASTSAQPAAPQTETPPPRLVSEPTASIKPAPPDTDAKQTPVTPKPLPQPAKEASPTPAPPVTPSRRIIKWTDARFPDTNLDQLDELTGELFHPDKKDHSIVHVNESAFPKKGASILINKVKNKLDNGKVIPDNTKNQEGFMLFSQHKPKQEEFKKLGENCRGKLKILGNMGKARFPLMWATQGKLYKDGKETDTVYQRYEISEVVEKSHHRNKP